jgi:hypothetical protein
MSYDCPATSGTVVRRGGELGPRVIDDLDVVDEQTDRPEVGKGERVVAGLGRCQSAAEAARL